MTINEHMLRERQRVSAEYNDTLLRKMKRESELVEAELTKLRDDLSKLISRLQESRNL